MTPKHKKKHKNKSKFNSAMTAQFPALKSFHPTKNDIGRRYRRRVGLNDYDQDKQKD